MPRHLQSTILSPAAVAAGWCVGCLVSPGDALDSPREEPRARAEQSTALRNSPPLEELDFEDGELRELIKKLRNVRVGDLAAVLARFDPDSEPDEGGARDLILAPWVECEPLDAVRHFRET